MRPAAIVLVCVLIGGSFLGIGVIGWVAWNASHDAARPSSDAADLAAHPFWTKPLTEQRVNTILGLMVEGRNAELYVDPSGRVWDRMEAALKESSGDVAAVVGIGSRPHDAGEAARMLRERLDAHMRGKDRREKVRRLRNP